MANRMCVSACVHGKLCVCVREANKGTLATCPPPPCPAPRTGFAHQVNQPATHSTEQEQTKSRHTHQVPVIPFLSVRMTQQAIQNSPNFEKQANERFKKLVLTFQFWIFKELSWENLKSCQ